MQPALYHVKFVFEIPTVVSFFVVSQDICTSKLALEPQ